MREKWICPNMDVQVFKPQEFVAACEEDIYYEWTSIGGNGTGVIDDGLDKIYGDYEKNNGHHKTINPHASTLTFTENAANYIISNLGKAWGFVGADQHSINNNHTLCYLIEVDESQANSGNPLDIQHITIPMATAGHGAYAFDIKSKPVKNLS